MARRSSGWSRSATISTRTCDEAACHRQTLARQIRPAEAQRLAQAITDDITRVLNYGDESVSVAIEEVDSSDWAEKVYRPDIVRGRRQASQETRIHDVSTQTMHGTVLYAPHDVRFEAVAAPTILEPTDAILSLPATCICGSDLWPYRGAQPDRPDRRRWATNTAASSRKLAATSRRFDPASL